MSLEISLFYEHLPFYAPSPHPSTSQLIFCDLPSTTSTSSPPVLPTVFPVKLSDSSTPDDTSTSSTDTPPCASAQSKLLVRDPPPVVAPPSAHLYPLRHRTAPTKLTYTTCPYLSSEFHAFLATIHPYQEYGTFKKVVDILKWHAVMLEELDAFKRTSTWDLIPFVPYKISITHRWVYEIKTHFDGSTEHYKSRLVCHGFEQEHGINFKETFAPVAHMTTVQTLINMVAFCQWPLLQLDMKNALVCGDLHYMVPPRDFLILPHVCHLHHALYNLHRAPHAWFELFSHSILTIGFT